ncbi:MAG: DUF763 domain-containing protein [Nitrospirae bacterium]|nr:MAG: DUF763 domain-containing protein [Nitrospirota bacterium]
MKKTGTATLPLHGGRAPAWLFKRMKLLAREIGLAIVSEFGTGGFLERLSDPFWFQCLGATVGFDWHSSGLTTTLCGAIKEGFRGLEHDTGIYIAGGKGLRARNTPHEIRKFSDKTGLDPEPLIRASRLSARVDNNALQDGFQIYHHLFVHDQSGEWIVIQQGMSDREGLARRYHWSGRNLGSFVNEPHSGICSDGRVDALNLVARESERVRGILPEIAARSPEKNIEELKRITSSGEGLFDRLDMPRRHWINPATDIDPKRIERILLKTYLNPPADFTSLLETEGVGAKTIRALSLISELIYGEKPSFRDPARFSFAVGGKDGIPYPVNRGVYDRTIEIMKTAIERAKVGNREKLDAVRRLMNFSRE